MDDVVNWIKEYFTKDHCHQFTTAWRNANYLYSHLIPKEHRNIPDLLVWFEVDQSGIIWDDEYEIKKKQDNRGQSFFEFQSDISVSGKAGYSVGYEEVKTDASYNLTLKAFLYDGTFTIYPDNIRLWTKEQKILTEYNELIFTKYQALGLGEIEKKEETAYSAFKTIWAKGNKNDAEQTATTSYFYYREIIDAYDQLRFCIANVNAYMPYTSNYLAKEQYQAGRVLYDINLTMFDRRYLYFCGIAFEKLYSFWERIAYLAYQFIKPKGLTAQNLSFNKLILTLRKDCNNGLYPFFTQSNSFFHWFSDFEQNHHQAIQKYRHPLIHYKNKNEVYKGSYFAGTHSHWLKNSTEKEKLQELQEVNEQLGVFLTRQVSFCEIGFKNLIELIKELP